MSSFRYILRYLIDPHFNSSARIQELVAFCKQSQIEEVMMFITAEELSAGHPTEKELDDYIALGQALKRVLAGEGIALSLNPWSTTHHNSRGRRLREGQPFHLMVGENGVVSSITVCPLCQEWQSYLCRSFARMAAEVEPVAIWIEDDWRLRNHDPQLGWGGCFCKEHLRRFSARVGEEVSRQQLLENILKPGTPHPWREHWLDLSRETMLEPLKRLKHAVSEAAPKVRLALMSSNPDAHAAEGRDWHCFQEVLGEPFLSRPNMGPYTQYHALNSPPSVTRMTVANLHGKIEVYPELENSPRCGPYSKSQRFSLWQIQHCALLGAAGVTINHYDMLGNGISLDPPYGTMLHQAKPLLNALRALELDDRSSGRVKVLFSPRISRAIHTPDGKHAMSQLSQDSTVWSRIAFILGIAHGFTSQPYGDEGALLVSGQTLRCFSDKEIERLLAGKMILDALSVEVLLERGYGKALGIRSARRRHLSKSAYSYEAIEPHRWYGEDSARMSAQRISSWLLEMHPDEGSEVLSTICHPEGHSLWPGAVLHCNAFGGKVISLTYPFPGDAQLFMAFFNIYRKRFFEHLLFDCLGVDDLAVVEAPAVHAYQTPTNDGVLFGALNPADDPAEIVWRVKRNAFVGGKWLHLSAAGEWVEVHVKRMESGSVDRLSFGLVAEPLTGIYLRWINEG